jgi:hypothetical protein
MSLSFLALATKTSWPHSSSTLLAYGEWVPASIAIHMGCSETKRRLRVSGVVRSLLSSITSPLPVSMRQRGRSSCRLCPILLSCLVVLCYHHSWADPPSWTLEPVWLLQTYSVLRTWGSAFSSHLRRTPSTRSSHAMLVAQLLWDRSTPAPTLSCTRYDGAL